MSQNNQAVFETEKKFRCTDVEGVIQHALSIGFIKTHENIGEHDIYFTDKEHHFIEQRICLRIRQTEVHCEITHKGVSVDKGALYSKLENNIQIPHNNKENAISLLQSLGFLKDVDVKKIRNLYRKKIEKLVYTIAIDYIENTGYFVELEIVSQYAMQKKETQTIFNAFVDLFNDFNLQEEILPYRDIVRSSKSKQSKTK